MHWLSTDGRPLLRPSDGSWNGLPISAQTSTAAQAGDRCCMSRACSIYATVTWMAGDLPGIGSVPSECGHVEPVSGLHLAMNCAPSPLSTSTALDREASATPAGSGCVPFATQCCEKTRMNSPRVSHWKSYGKYFRTRGLRSRLPREGERKRAGRGQNGGEI